MKLRHFRKFLVFCTALLFGIQFTFWVLSEPKTAYSFTVRIPKAYNPNFTDEEFLEYFRAGNTIPMSELEKRDLPLVPNCGLLYLSLSLKGNIKINSQDIATLENTTPLTEKLSEVFREREKAGVYEPQSNKIVKTVIVKAPLSAKYDDVVKVIDAVKSSGADPIILQIDDLPQ